MLILKKKKSFFSQKYFHVGVARLAYFVTRVKELNTESNVTLPYNKCGTHNDLVWKSLRLLHQVLFLLSGPLSHTLCISHYSTIDTHTYAYDTVSLSPHTRAHTHTQASLVKACESVRRCKDVTGRQSVWARRLPASFHQDGNNNGKKDRLQKEKHCVQTSQSGSFRQMIKITFWEPFISVYLGIIKRQPTVAAAQKPHRAHC